MNSKIHMLWVLVLSLVLFARAEAAMVMPFSVEELVGRSDKIFVGTCTKVEHSVNAQGLPVLDVTFAVAEALKGEVGSTITFRQLDPTLHEEVGKPKSMLWSAAVLAGVPTYTLGEEAMIFLAQPGGIGLTAPVGLFQGKLPIKALDKGGKVITNTALKKTTLTTVSLPEPGNTASYDAVVKAVRTIAQSVQ